MEDGNGNHCEWQWIDEAHGQRAQGQSHSDLIALSISLAAENDPFNCTQLWPPTCDPTSSPAIAPSDAPTSDPTASGCCYPNPADGRTQWLSNVCGQFVNERECLALINDVGETRCLYLEDVGEDFDCLSLIPTEEPTTDEPGCCAANRTSAF